MQQKLPNAKFHYRIDYVAELMTQADLAIGATGVATWERAAVGLPTLAISVAENQQVIASNAQEQGLLTWIGNIENLTDDLLLYHINEAFTSPDRLRRQSEACLALVDAKGAQRVADAMI